MSTRQNSRMKILGAAVISAIAIGAVGFTAGCQTQEVLKDRPLVPAPSNQEPSGPALAAPAVVAKPIAAPALPPPAPVKAKPAAPVVETVPK